MSLITCHDWTYEGEHEYAPTNDPRIIAVIQRDDEASFSRCLDGDAILPTYLIDRDRADHVGGYDDDESLANRIVEARDRFRYAAGYRYNGLTGHMMERGDELVARWAWIFHGTTIHRGSYGYQSDYDVLVMNTPAFREHVGVEEQTCEEAQSWCDSMKSEVQAIADGDVYGIGYGTLDVLPEDMEEEPTFEDYTVEIECWGFVGDDYAKQSAGAFEAGAPELPPMLNFAA